MADFANTMKDMLSRSAKFIGRTFNAAASETKYKANEISINNKRRELVTELGKKVLELTSSGLELTSSGLELPQEAATLVDQINKLDADLDLLRNDHAAQKAAAAEQHAMEKAARATEKAAAKAAAAIEKSTEAVAAEVPMAEDAAPEGETPAAPSLELDIEEAVDAQEKPDVPTLNV